MIKKQDGELKIVKVEEEGVSSPTTTAEVNKENTTNEITVSKVEEVAPKEAITIVGLDEEVTPLESTKEEYPNGSDEVYEEDVDEEDVEIVEKDTSTKPKESITIVGLDEVKDKPKVEPTVIDPIEAVNQSIKDAGLQEILTDEEEAIVDGLIDRTKVADSTTKGAVASHVFVKKNDRCKNNSSSTSSSDEEVQKEAVSILTKFKEFVTSSKFDKQCEKASQKHGVPKNIIKNKTISNFLGTIAKMLGLSITIAGDIIIGAVNFVSYVINRIVMFAVDNLMKVVTLLTVNCGDTMQ